jgi:hypothetical protein
MIFSNVIHIILVKKNLLPMLLIPISKPLFGVNKTLRGFILVTFLNAFFFEIINLFNPLFSHLESLFFGAILGLSYMIFELPNSFLKRRLGISSGKKATKNAWIFILLDKSDSAFGISLGTKLLFGFTWLETLELFIIGILLHFFFSWLLVALRIKKSF